MDYDYRALLIKYIQWVGECEGVVFLSDNNLRHSYFTDEEKRQLQILDKESQESYYD